VKVLGIEQIEERLNDAFRLLSSGSPTVPRHRMIRETIDWSLRLLSEEEQILLGWRCSRGASPSRRPRPCAWMSDWRC
jgi:predicted ATPase